jgi:exodeoxyribonuclease-3
MKIVCFNINGIRARPHQLEEIIVRHAPDVIGLQETKVADDQFPLADIHRLGYQAIYHGQKGHYGVALLFRTPPIASACGFPDDGEDSQRRLIKASFAAPGGDVHIYNAYFPQGESRAHPLKFPAKAAFYRAMLTTLQRQHLPTDRVVVMGDMNVAPRDIDIGIGEDNRKRWLRTGKCCFLPEEREWYAALTSWGLEDTFRKRHGDRLDAYSWFDYRSRGFEQEPPRGLRIDFILASKSLCARVEDGGIDLDIRAMERPSDHCPIWAEFRL